MRGYDFFLLIFCLSVVLVPLLFVSAWIGDRVWLIWKMRQDEKRAEVYVKRVMGDK